MSLETVSSSSPHEPREDLRHVRKREVSRPALTRTLSSGTRTAKYTITAATQSMHTDYYMFEGLTVKGNAARYFRAANWSSKHDKPGKFLGKTGRGRFVKREANAGGLA